jgi:hypothetical protein
MEVVRTLSQKVILHKVRALAMSSAIVSELLSVGSRETFGDFICLE